jgi:hypothetical protein
MTDLPIACALDASTLAERSDVLLPGLARRATGLCWLESGARLTFGFDASLLMELADVIAAEHQCCRFLRFNLLVEPGDSAAVLDVTGPDGTLEFLKQLLSAER